MQTEPTATTDTSHPIDDSTFDQGAFFKEHLVKGDNGRLAIQGDTLNPMELAFLDTEIRRRGEQGAK